MKFNKFNIGDTIKHQKSDSHIFIIIEVLPTVPEKSGDYFYECRLIDSDSVKSFYNYHENELIACDEVCPLTRVAYHEAGHAIACKEMGIKMNNVNIVGNETTSGRVNVVPDFLIPDIEASEKNAHKIEKYIIATLAGAASERLKFGSNNEELCANDFQVAFDLAMKLCGSMKLTNAYIEYLNLQAESLFFYLDEEIDAHTMEWSQVESLVAYLLRHDEASASKIRAIARKIK